MGPSTASMMALWALIGQWCWCKHGLLTGVQWERKSKQSISISSIQYTNLRNYVLDWGGWMRGKKPQGIKGSQSAAFFFLGTTEDSSLSIQEMVFSDCNRIFLRRAGSLRIPGSWCDNHFLVPSILDESRRAKRMSWLCTDLDVRPQVDNFSSISHSSSLSFLLPYAFLSTPLSHFPQYFTSIFIWYMFMINHSKITVGLYLKCKWPTPISDTLCFCYADCFSHEGYALSI